MKVRKFVQVEASALTDNAVVTTALADDGTVWGGDNHGAWYYLGEAPQAISPNYLSLYESGATNETVREEKNEN